MPIQALARFVDTRFDTTNRSILQVLGDRRIEAYCDHIANGAFVVGEAQKDWRDFVTMPVRVSTGDNSSWRASAGTLFSIHSRPPSSWSMSFVAGPACKPAE
jgi:hypothetical protein